MLPNSASRATISINSWFSSSLPIWSSLALTLCVTFLSRYLWLSCMGAYTPKYLNFAFNLSSRPIFSISILLGTKMAGFVKETRLFLFLREFELSVSYSFGVVVLVLCTVSSFSFESGCVEVWLILESKACLRRFGDSGSRFWRD